jgi:hypothetical protein
MGSSSRDPAQNLALRTPPVVPGSEVALRSTMRTFARTGVIVGAVSVTVSFLTVCVPGVGAAHVVPAAGENPVGNASWAYGTVRTATASGHGGTYAYEVSATAGFAVVLNETTTSAGNYSLHAHRTMGLLLSVEYCRPTCTHPTTTATVLYHTWESLTATLGVTSLANVTVNASPVAAVGLRSSNVSVEAGLHLASSVVVAGVLVNERNLTVGFDSNSSTSFTPALGLVPIAVTPAEEWTASAGVNVTGFASWSLTDAHPVAPVPSTVDRKGGFSLNQTGTVGLSGDDPGSTVHLGGSTYDVLDLSLTEGPFVLREGFLLIPTASDLFGASPPSWLTSNASDTGSVNVSQASIDVSTSRLTTTNHLGFEASGMWWDSATQNPAPDAVGVTGTGLAPAAAAPAVVSNATYLQGSPESVGQATTDQNCLSTGVGCPSSGSPRGLFGLLLVAGGVGVVVVVAALLIAERRRVPPPAYPNAGLYPPGAPTRPAVGPVRPPSRAPSPPEDDPLGHLW